MKQPKLVVGYLMDDELSVKSVTISKSLDWLTRVEIEDLVEFFGGLLELITQISEGKEDSESLQVFLALWREVALEVSDMEDEDRETFWKTLTDSIERAMNTAGQSILVGFDEDDEDELDSPWIDIIDRQPERRGIMHHSPYGEPVVADVTEEERDHYLAQPISELGLSTRAHNCLIRENINTIRELVVKMDWELLQYNHFGQGSLRDVKEGLANMGLSLGMDLNDEDYEADE
ncbi:MAG: hypothetical protein OXN25_01270 [Candidatus Poribacteria bacterium]|nr:hypothetical protein [Candidatus Poribacteria bacterium]